MTIAADIDLEQVDRDFDVAVRSEIDADDGRPSDASLPCSPHDAARSPGLGTVATVIVLCAGFAGTAACVVGLAAALHTVAELAWSSGQPDVRYDLVCAGAWLSAGAAGVLAAVGFRRSAIPVSNDVNPSAKT